MKTKFAAPIAVALFALAISSGNPALAQSYNGSCGQPQSWAQRLGSWQQAAPAWQNSSGLGNIWSQVRGAVLPNSPNSSYSYMNANANNYNGYGMTPVNYSANYPYQNNAFGNIDPNYLYQETDRLNREAQKIQNKLANRRLNPDQIMNLQNRLAQIDAQRVALNNTAATQLSGARQYMQNLLSSGSYTDPNQSYYAQDRLSQVNNLLSQLGGGTTGALGNTGVLASLRSLLGF